ncbi:MAG: helix-turn-helix transcriptional regulator, partial [Bacilli bacterium]|nr:helix-turn-helix transcriptional regulator [Bacilli bacterium]
MDLGSKIKNIRYNNNISQEEMAKILKINRNYLSRIETNKSLPTAEVLTRLAIEFHVSIDSLL